MHREPTVPALQVAQLQSLTCSSSGSHGQRISCPRATEMSKLRVESQVDPVAWNATLRTLSGTVFQTPEWARCVRTEERGTRPEFFSLLDDDGSVQGLALGF